MAHGNLYPSYSGRKLCNWVAQYDNLFSFHVNKNSLKPVIRESLVHMGWGEETRQKGVPLYLFLKHAVHTLRWIEIGFKGAHSWMLNVT
jgi:hypothetical protein